ncbi:MAG: glycosyltransferase family 4 protein [Alphaproteobacteria bacterium]
MLRLLTYTSLYPNAVQPTFGVFVENRLRHLVASGRVTSRVIAPVPWFPFESRLFPVYSGYARMPREEQRHGLLVMHPRFIAIPKIGMNVAPRLLYAATAPLVARLVAGEPGVDLIDAHYAYPDGVAAAWLGRRFDLPVVLTVRGSDVNVLSHYDAPRRRILETVRSVAGLITVSRGLKDRLVELGVADQHIVVLRNGVDLDAFQPVDKDAAMRALGLEGRVVLSVGQLVALKGLDLTIRALAKVPDTTLLIVGEGPERSRLEALTAAEGVGHRVRFVGRVDHDRLKTYFSAANLSVLASRSEGWANVLLESMACGTPVVATDIPGTREVVGASEAGFLVPRTVEAIADGIRRLLAKPPSRAATRAYAERFGWEDTTRGQLALFESILERHRASRSLTDRA